MCICIGRFKDIEWRRLALFDFIFLSFIACITRKPKSKSAVDELLLKCLAKEK